METGLRGQVALVTAASRGLGLASARALAQEGADVVICARSADIVATAAQIARETGVRTLGVQADVTVQADIDRLIAATVAEFGRIDILILNAGGPPSGSFLDLTPDDWEAATRLTLMSAVRLCYGVIPLMLTQQGGSIVAIESVSVKHPIDNLILSNAIRLAVIGLLKSLANEFGGRGIRVNSVNPTFTLTDRTGQLLAARAARDGNSVEEQSADIVRTIPLGRMGTPEEFGRVVAWIASPAAAFIHGHALMFDGGATRTPL
jgi:3-oxoacyl-[acyl-carrier protein] reductase